MLYQPLTTTFSLHLRVVIGCVLVASIIVGALSLFIIQTKLLVYTAQQTEATEVPTPTPFPISVNPQTESIVTVEGITQYVESELADATTKPIRTSWWSKATRKLAQLQWYQSLASPSSRILVIWPGDRHEQVVDNIGDILRWNQAERDTFTRLVTETTGFNEGGFAPGQYVTSVGARPEDVAVLVTERFSDTVTVRYDNTIAAIVPLQDALTFASLLEREAYSFEDMRMIAGIMWNRLFIDMPLQLDASLQYVKANSADSASWWPPVRSQDKYIDSPYNTYQNKGLPAGPIANPSAATIVAALNPYETDCLFYFHHSDGSFHCSVNYDEHVGKLQDFYGQGQ